MTHWMIRFIRPWRGLKANEVQAKIPMLMGPSSKKTWGLIPVGDPEVYPLIFCVATGLGLLTGYCIHNFTENPDVNVSKSRRETPTLDRYVPKEAEEFTKHHASLATLRANPVNKDDSFTPLTDGKSA